MRRTSFVWGWPIAFLLLIVCDASPAEPSGPAEIQLRIGGSSTVAANSAVTFVEVKQDSRCPTGVTCIWEGEAVVALEVRQQDQAPRTESLSTHSSRGSSPNSVRVGEVSVRLVGLDPYPVAGAEIEPSEYLLTLRAE